jgi:endoglucanase
MTRERDGLKAAARFALCIVLICGTRAFADVAPLSVRGNQILAGGKPASFAGNSLFWSNTGWGGEKFYNANVVGWLKTDWKAGIVRAAMGVEAPGGYLQDPGGNMARVKAVVDAAIANDMYAIIDWHSHRAESNRGQAIAFFQEMARTYGTHNHVVYEIYNEPLKISWSGQIKPYAEAVVGAIRAIDPDNLIVVGTPGWSQDVDVAAADPIPGINIAYTLHFYAGSHGQSLRDKAQIALDRGVALFVTEWGSVNANGDGSPNMKETNAWMRFLEARGISHANWATNDKSEGASALVPGASVAGGWPVNQLTASGTLAKQIVSRWGSRETRVAD